MTPAPMTPQTTTTSVKAPWGCSVESTLTVTENGRLDFSNLTRHINRPECECRRNPDPKQEHVNEETVSRHAHKLWTSGKCDAVEMLNTFAKLKLGLPVPEGLELHWNEENKLWGGNPQAESPEETKASRSAGRKDWAFASTITTENTHFTKGE
ncbi:hypothetical protein F5Y10DRAFT_285557 [Nemania abortiva]|nr:hypothetical protein F5Y10DRAFT_285557 [Nemania abortiva]